VFPSELHFTNSAKTNVKITKMRSYLRSIVDDIDALSHPSALRFRLILITE
jgi:hypothetical protein